MKRWLLSGLAVLFFAMGAFAQSGNPVFDGAHYQLAAHHPRHHHHRRGHHHHHNHWRA